VRRALAHVAVARAALAALALVVGAASCAPSGPGAGQSRHRGEGEGEGEGEEGEGEGEGEGEPWDGTVVRERSLVWTHADLVDDADVVSLRRALTPAAQALDTTPGALLDAWLRKFATTAHSERAGPAQLADALRDSLGDDPSAWDLDDVPFKVTGVHNRVDLKGTNERGPHCGQLRVSLASQDPVFRPFHALFLFAQPATSGDVDGDDVHCRATSLAWARLSDLAHDDFVSEARAMLDAAFVPERFLMVESVELTVSPWEWRQWIARDGSMENPPLFQQVDAARLNEPGPAREDFLTFVEANAAALAARTLLLPERFRAPSVRVTQGVPWAPLDLTGVSSALLAERPTLRGNIEIVGCAACHTADAEFVQTREDRTFSPFYDKELTARAVLLDDLVHRVPRVVPFGPLQSDPVLHP
jgi:hypothetical protein